MDKNISEIKIKNLSDTDEILNLLWDKRIPIVGACSCIDMDENYMLKPVCRDKHIVLVPRRHYEIAQELIRSIEEDFPVLY